MEDDTAMTVKERQKSIREGRVFWGGRVACGRTVTYDVRTCLA